MDTHHVKKASLVFLLILGVWLGIKGMEMNLIRALELEELNYLPLVIKAFASNPAPTHTITLTISSTPSPVHTVTIMPTSTTTSSPSATATPTSTATPSPSSTATSTSTSTPTTTPTPTPYIFVQEAESPDEFTVGTFIFRSKASAQAVHGQFGCSAGGSQQAGYVKYLNIVTPNTTHLYFRLRYSKFSVPLATIEIYLDNESTPRASFTPQSQGDWNLFTWSNEMDLGAVTNGAHELKISTDGQQFCTADLDIFTLTTWSDATFREALAYNTWTYLSSDWSTTNHLPWSWRSVSSSNGDYANPAEIGFYALSWLAAYDLQRPWSPAWPMVEVEITAVLDQLRTWQIGPPGSNGPNAYNNSVFYQWYWINQTPPEVGPPTGTNQDVPSIDNAWLAMSLLTIREYAEQNEQLTLAQKADEILTEMDFSLWYDADANLFHWGGFQDPQAGDFADVYSNENRIINFIARAMGHLTPTEFQESLVALTANSGTYNGITVEKVAHDGSIFTYLSPALFIRELETDYGQNTINPAVQAQMAYAHANGYVNWGLSDCFDLGTGDNVLYIQQGAPPADSPGPLETHPGVITPHASGLALISQYATDSLANLHILAQILPNTYDPTYGFLDSVMSRPIDVDYGETTDRFGTLDQQWLFLSLVNAQTGFIWEYFYLDSGVITAHTEMFGTPPGSPFTTP